MSLFILILLLILTICYNSYTIYLNKGVPESISNTAYILNKRRYLFSLYCFLLVCGLLPVWLGVSIVTYRFLVFISCMGILFAGVTPFFKENNTLDKPIHYTAGIIAVIAYLIWMILSGYYVALIIEGIISLILVLIDYKNFVYYIEIIGLITLLLILI